MKKEIVDNDEIIIIIIEIEEEDRTFKYLKKEYQDKINELEETLPIYMGENDLKISKTGFPDKWKCLTKKLA